MLHYTLVFFILAVVATVLGMGGIAVTAMEIARVLFTIFIVLFLVSLITGGFRRTAI